MGRNSNKQGTPATGSRHTSNPTPDREQGRISPTFALFAALDGAVRKTRNRAYQKSGIGDGPAHGEGRATSETHAVQGRQSTPANARPNKRKLEGTASTVPAKRSHKKKEKTVEPVVVERELSQAVEEKMEPPKRSHKKKVVEPVQVEKEQSPAAEGKMEVPKGKRKKELVERFRIEGKPSLVVERIDEDEDEVIIIASRSPSVSAQGHHIQKQAEQSRPTAQHCPHRAVTVESVPESDLSSAPNSPIPQPPLGPSGPSGPTPISAEAVIAQEIEKQKTILYGFPISLLTSSTRNWMPILDKKSLIYQAISQVMDACDLSNATPMIARRLRWIGKGKAVQRAGNRNRLGKFMSTKGKDAGGSGGNATDPGAREEWNIDAERRTLVGGIIDLQTVVQGIDRGREKSPTRHLTIGNHDEFVDVDIPLHVLLAGTESIAFTNLGFYRIYVPEKDQPFPLRECPMKPSKLNWDPEASRVEPSTADGKRTQKRQPWNVTFMGYEWEEVRLELLEEDDNAEEENREWVTTMAGYRVLRMKEGAEPHTLGLGQVIGAGGKPTGIGLGEAGQAGVQHPWGRDYMETPDIGLYVTKGSYKEIVKSWFPWAWENESKANGWDEENDVAPASASDMAARGGVRRKAAVEAEKKVKGSAGYGYGNQHTAGAGAGKSGTGGKIGVGGKTSGGGKTLGVGSGVGGKSGGNSGGGGGMSLRGECEKSKQAASEARKRAATTIKEGGNAVKKARR